LLTFYGAGGKLVSCHEHNQLERLPEIEAAIRAGQIVALISDAGMPLISDPGAPLVAALQAKQLPVTVIPGANAALAALSLSGLPSDRFCFIGFLPAKSAARRQELSALAGIPATLIFYESPQRLTDMLVDIEAILGERAVAVVRELTKLHEEVRRGNLQDLVMHFSKHEPRGEIVVLVAPPHEAAKWDAEAVDAALSKQGGSLRDAVAVVTAQSGWPKREVYARAVALQQQRGKR
jgi:16S rRNA (cytidine1402-2'-O)-methyltransferase